jgi:protease-4
MKVFFKAYLGSLLAGFTFVFLFFLVILLIPKEEKITVRDNSVLKLELNGLIQERSIDDPFASLGMGGEEAMGLDDLLKSLKAAKDDDRIQGVFLELGGVAAGTSTLKELRNALLDFKTSEKFIWSYADIYGQADYYLASVSDSIYFNPSGYFDWHGLAISQPYAKDMFEKIGVEPIVVRGSNNKFKSAVEPFLLNEMSEENNQQLSMLLWDVWGEIKSEVARARNMSEDSLQSIADGFKAFTPKRALAYGMVDELTYRNAIYARLKDLTEARSEKTIPMISPGRYVQAMKSKKDSENEIAVIYAQGDIVMGEGEEGSIGPEKYAAVIRKAADDDDIKAIVLRVNSPGGSALGSDIIHNELVRAKSKKPLIVSMGDLAASGGYFISAPADTIVAHPTTITGSIGVFMLYFTAQKLLEEKVGLHFSTVKTAEMADIMSPNRGLTDAEYKMFQESVDETYGEFIKRVMNGRGLDSLFIDSIGQGRVWTGVRAKEMGLIDELGGIQMAIDIAASKAGLEDYSLKSMPKQKNTIEQLMEEFGAASVKQRVLKEELGEYYDTYAKLQTLLQHEGMLMRMPVDIEIK